MLEPYLLEPDRIKQMPNDSSDAAARFLRQLEIARVLLVDRLVALDGSKYTECEKETFDVILSCLDLTRTNKTVATALRHMEKNG